jgi:tetratricopeptide (TPR) repeat protein/tRNA A-37 threonylcarbamoyl transferase component Bud32
MHECDTEAIEHAPEHVLPTPALEDEPVYADFERGDVVGRGSNAIVYEATVADNADWVIALKEPHAPEEVSAAITDRFRSEAETWAGLADHDNVVVVHAWATDPVPWIALEYVDDGSLADRTGECGVNQALWIGARVAAAIDHAHQNGVAHLDLKPENVLFRESPGDAWSVPKVADWGMAAFLQAETLNLEGLSPRYAAPEQFAPDRHGPPGARTDVYQLGIVLYELLVGTVPFDGPPRVLRDAVLEEPPPAPSGRNPSLPAAVNDVLDRALAKDPADRYASMAAFRRELERLLAARTRYEPADDASSAPESGVRAVPRDSAPEPAASATTAGAATSPYERALTLAEEGFVQLSERYFARRTPVPPLEAWRRGVRLVDAHAGRAVERVVPREGENGEGRVVLTDLLLDELRSGSDHVVLGPPGSGKSTVCKGVACEWFDRGYGPVFYRESGQGERFDRPDALARRVTDTASHALVVVEDAVRPEAEAVFAFLDRVADREDVTVLLDAREAEWREAGRGADAFGTDPAARGREALDPVYVPRPDAREHERFVRAAETATDRPVEIDIGQLQADITEAAASELDDDETQPGELFYLLHRLTALARDPLTESDTPTTMTDAVADAYERLADLGDDALDVGICVNLLNTAGIGVYPELLYAVAPDEPLAVDDAIDVLDGRAVFPREADWSDGTTAYPAVHEAWSTEFLVRCLDANGEDAACERFGRVLTQVLSLANDDARREQIVGTLSGDAPYLARIDADPAAWADETVEQMFGLADDSPRLAPLFGTTDTAAYDLPKACSAARRRSVLLTRGDAHRGASDYERARSEYETALERARGADDQPRVAASLKGLGTVARLQNDYEKAREYYQHSLEIARDLDDRRLEAEVLNHLGTSATSRSEYDKGRQYVERSLEISRELGDRLSMARCLQTLGRIAYRQSDHERAREQLHRSLEVKRELGDRPGIARSLNRLGTTATAQGDYEQARRYLLRSLELWRDLDSRIDVAGNLHNLGIVATEQGEYERAREYYQQSLETIRDLNAPDVKALNFNMLGRVAEQQNNYEQAREYHQRTLEIWREPDDRHGIARALQDLGSTARGLGDLTAAREYLDRSLEIYRDVGDEDGRAECLQKLGAVAYRRENYDDARERYETARSIFENTGNVGYELNVLEDLIELERDTGNHERAREHCETARQRLDATDSQFSDVRGAIQTVCGTIPTDE